MRLPRLIVGYISYRNVELLLKIAAVYLALWWTLFFLMLTEAVEVLPYLFLPYIHILPIIYVASIGLWLCGTKIGKQFWWLLLLVFLLASIFYFMLTILKGLPSYKVGSIVYIIAIAYILSRGRVRSATPA